MSQIRCKHQHMQIKLDPYYSRIFSVCTSVVYNQALQHVYRNKMRGGLGHVLRTANGVLNT